MNRIKLSLLAAVMAASVGNIATSAAAVDISVQIAPPTPRYEAVPPPRHGYVWVPGYWDWRGQRHVWVGGTWARERPGYSYRAPRWEQRDGRWALNRGDWVRGDRDHDGIPNRADRDRDGDGVPNRRDRQPDNPRRY